MDGILFFYIGTTLLLLLHCVSAAYFVASGKRKSKKVKAAVFLTLAIVTSAMVSLLFFEALFESILQQLDALMLMSPLVVCVCGDVLMFRVSVTKRYTTSDGARTRRRMAGM
jgi:ABC-type uncharacterized transport system permease subunit